MGSAGGVANSGELVADLVDPALQSLHVSVDLALKTADAFLDVAQVRLQSSGGLSVCFGY